MSKPKDEPTHRRNALTNERRRERFEATHEAAMAAIKAEADARLRKTERLKMARRAAEDGKTAPPARS